MRHFLIQSHYIASGDVMQLSIETSPDEASWNALRKYVSREITNEGNRFMVHDDQTFYYQTWTTEPIIPDFATVYVLDTSGSMSKKDFKQASYAITGEIYEYNNYDTSSPNSRMYVYSASKLKTMSVYQSVFGTIPFGEASLSEIWNSVSPFIEDVRESGTGGSESMITNLYYSIAETVKRMFYNEGSTSPGATCLLSAASFILLTDESIFTNDTTDAVDWLTNPQKSDWYSEWFDRWQSNNNNDNKFPTSGGWNHFSDAAKRDACRSITNALKQMSYYYGVNFNWGLYGGLAVGRDKTPIQDKYNSSDGRLTDNGTSFWLNTVVSLDPEGSGITYVDNQAWVVPTNFHVDYPHERMCRIALEISSDYIAPGKTEALKSGDELGSLTMRYDDQFDST